jgi:WD40 repeat protein
LLGGTVISLFLAWWATDEARVAKAQTKVAEESAERADREKESADRKRLAAEREKTFAERQKLAAEREKTSAERQLYLARIVLAWIAYRDHDPKHTDELLAATRPRPGGQDFRHFEWYYLQRKARSEVRRFRESAVALALSPDGKRLALGSDKGVTVRDVQTGDVVATFAADFVYGLAFSPDGQRLAGAVGAHPYVASGNKHTWRGAAVLWDLSSKKTVMTAPEPGWFVYNVAFSPDGKRLAASVGRELPQKYPGLPFPWPGFFVKVWSVPERKLERSVNWYVARFSFAPDGRRLLGGVPVPLAVYDLAKGEVVPRKLLPLVGVAFSADGKLVATTREREVTLTLHDGDTDKALRPLAGAPGVVQLAAFDPSGRRLAGAAHYGGWVTVWNTDISEARYTLRAHTGRVLALAWSGDGRWLATAGDDGLVKVWDAERGNRPLFLHKKGHDYSGTVAFTPDGLRVAASGLLVDIRSGREIRAFSKGRSALSPDGRYLATAGADKVLRIWETECGREVRSFPAHKTEVFCDTLASRVTGIASVQA